MRFHLIFGFFFWIFTITSLTAQVELSDVHAFLQNKYACDEADLPELRLRSGHKDTKTGVYYSYWQQYHNDRPLHNVLLSICSKNDEIVHQQGHFAPKKALKSADFHKNEPLYILKSALESFHIKTSQIHFLRANEGGDSLYFSLPDIHDEEVETMLYAMYMYENDKIIPAWNLSLPPHKNDIHWWQIRLSDENGEVMAYNSWTQHCQHTQKKTFTPNTIQKSSTENEPESGSGYYVYRFPLESPLQGEQTIISEPADSLASPAGWHGYNPGGAIDYTHTRGNNVFAYEDLAANDKAGYSPDGGNDLQFLFTADTAQNYLYNVDANITQLFYSCNKSHDLFYRYGFTEDAGNFQEHNFGRGGLENDPIIAEGMDGRSIDGAAFIAPPDGQSGRIEIYPWVQYRNTRILEIQHPASIGGVYEAYEATFSPPVNQQSIQALLVLIDDGSSEGSKGCMPPINDILGKIVLIDRGSCEDIEKVENAQASGAVGVIMVNDSSMSPYSMSGASNYPINIPVVMISQNLGQTIKNALLQDTVEVHLRDSIGSLLYDGSLDNGLVVHEYTHGVSMRLTGGPLNADCLNNLEQAGEGWSDFFSLAFLTDSSRTASESRTLANFLLGEDENGPGVRIAPYSTNSQINDLDYEAIKTVGIPHGLGTVWASMLWDMYWALVEEHGFDSDLYGGSGGNNIAIQLVMDGMKLQACRPGFVDSRNAILMADSLRYGGVNSCLIWQVFADRGLGYSADQKSSDNIWDGISAYDLPLFCKKVSIDKEKKHVEHPNVYPNPVEDNLYIAFPKKMGKTKLQLYDLKGGVILERNVSILGGEKMHIPLSHLPAGVYFVRIESEQAVISNHKIVKK